MRTTLATGPVGTGFFLRGMDSRPDGTNLADLWWCLVFLPVIPLRRWQISMSEPFAAATTDLVVLAQAPIPLRSRVRALWGAAAGTVLSLSTLAVGVATVGVPWAIRPLRSLEAVLLRFIADHPRLLGTLSQPSQEKALVIIDRVVGLTAMSLETGILLAGAAIPVLVLMRLDLSTRRIPVADLWRRRGRRPVPSPGVDATQSHPQEGVR